MKCSYFISHFLIIQFLEVQRPGWKSLTVCTGSLGHSLPRPGPARPYVRFSFDDESDRSSQKAAFSFQTALPYGLFYFLKIKAN